MVVSMSKENFATSLHSDRVSLNFTQHEFCNALKEFTGSVVSQQTLARWENGAMPHYDNRVDLISFLKHIFELRGLESEVLKLNLLEVSKSEKIRNYLEINPNATGAEAAEAIGVSHGHYRMIKSKKGITNKNTSDELMKIIDEQASEIYKLKDVIKTLVS
jgi:transcriptional regulator with XRE-family HTH domain